MLPNMFVPRVFGRWTAWILLMSILIRMLIRGDDCRWLIVDGVRTMRVFEMMMMMTFHRYYCIFVESWRTFLKRSPTVCHRALPLMHVVDDLMDLNYDYVVYRVIQHLLDVDDHHLTMMFVVVVVVDHVMCSFFDFFENET